MPEQPRRTLRLRTVAGILLTLAGVWAVVATSPAQTTLESTTLTGAIDLTAGSTARLVFDLSPNQSASEIDKPQEFSISMRQRSGSGENLDIEGSIIGFVDMGPIDSSWTLQCVCSEPQLVVEFTLPADVGRFFETIDWTASAFIDVGDDVPGNAALDLTLAEVEQSTLSEPAAGIQPGTEFSALALDVDIQADGQLWIQSTAPAGAAAILVAPDGKQIRIVDEQTQRMECATGPCSGRFTLVSPAGSRGGDFEWRVIASSERTTVTQQSVDTRSTVYQLPDLEQISLDRDAPIIYEVMVSISDSPPAVAAFLLIKMNFNGPASNSVWATAPPDLGMNAVEDGFGAFVDLADGSAARWVDFEVSNREPDASNLDSSVTATVYWLPVDPNTTGVPELTITAEVTE